MTREGFHNKSKAKRRESDHPARLRFASRRGVTLVELMISMLILAIVCIAWLQIIGIQSARKEARRREAVERLVGMMDAFLYVNRKNTSFTANTFWSVETNAYGVIDFSYKKDDDAVHPIFNDDMSPVGYRLYIINKGELPNAERFGNNWGSCKWLVGSLYNYSSCSVEDAGKPFFTLPVCLGL